MKNIVKQYGLKPKVFLCSVKLHNLIRFLKLLTIVKIDEKYIFLNNIKIFGL